MSKKHPGRPKKEGPWDPCKASGCAKTVEGGVKGFCHSHYVSARRGLLDWESGEPLRAPLRVRSYGPGARCTTEGCERRPKALGFCEMHYQQQDTRVLSKTIPSYDGHRCLVASCTTRPVNRGMCSKHSQQRAAGILDNQGNQLRELKAWKRGPRAEKWLQADGYVLVQAPPGHPFARQDGSILEHRLVMEQQLGHYLDPDEFLVHHKDGNRGHNDPSNLEVLSARAKRGEGHHPGHEFSPLVAIQVLLQQPDLPDGMRQWLEWYKASLSGQKTAA